MAYPGLELVISCTQSKNPNKPRIGGENSASICVSYRLNWYTVDSMLSNPSFEILTRVFRITTVRSIKERSESSEMLLGIKNGVLCECDTQQHCQQAWGDPQDELYNGSVSAEWVRTKLVYLHSYFHVGDEWMVKKETLMRVYTSESSHWHFVFVILCVVFVKV